LNNGAKYPGVVGRAGNEASTFSRAYIGFKTPDDAVQFHKTFNGHVFLDSKGTEFKATVEIAPFQKIVKDQSPRDARSDTIHSGEHRIFFRWHGRFNDDTSP